MRISALLLTAGLIAASLQAQEPTADAEAVISAVLAQEAAVRGPESGAQTCVAPLLAGAPTPPGGESAMMLDHAVRIFFQWHAAPPPAIIRPPPPPDEPGRRPRRRRIDPIVPPPALAAAPAARLDALRAEAAAAPAPAGPGRLDAAVVPAPLHLQRDNEDCALLTLSTPAFAGDAAFVEMAYVCGSVCGQGNLYALERRDGRWQITGIADTWIR